MSTTSDRLFEQLEPFRSFLVPVTMKEPNRPEILKQVRAEARRQGRRLGRVFTVHAQPLGISVRRRADNHQGD